MLNYETPPHQIIGFNIDQAITLEMRSKSWPKGIIQPLLHAVQKDAQGPQVLKAALGLKENISVGDKILITCIAAQTPWVPNSETDGPAGGAVLARVISKGLGGCPHFVINEKHQQPTISACRALGIPVLSEQDKTRPGSAVMLDFPINYEQAEARALEVLHKYQPKAVIAIETMSPNPKGIVHSASGAAIANEEIEGAYFHVAKQASKQGIYTLGIGDAGNEFGMGRIYSAVREFHPAGAECRCECKTGIATDLSADALIVAGCSNWGAYGVAVMLAYLLEKPELFHTAVEEEHMLRQMAIAGANDAFTGESQASVDNIHLEAHIGLNYLLTEIVKNGLSE